MTLLHSAVATPAATLKTILVLTAIIVLAVLATAVFTGPGSGPSFDLIQDPAGSLWTW